MAQLKIKQIQDFVTGVEAKINALVGTATGTAIADAKSEAIAAAESKDVLRASTAVVNISTAKSEAIKAAVSADTVLSTAVSTAIATVDGRVTTLLNGSTEALDTFGEIKGFIDALSTADITVFDAISTAVSNDAVHATGISNNASGISANATAIANLEIEVDNLDFGVDLSLTADALQNVVDNTNGTGVTLEGANEEKAGLMTANDFRKLKEIEARADVTDSVNVRAAGALMDDEITNLAQVKAFDKTNFATSAQGDKADSALQSYSDLGLTVTEAELNQLASISVGDIITYNADAFDAKGDAAQALADAKKYTNDEIAALDLHLQGEIDGLANLDEKVAKVLDGTRVDAVVPFDLRDVKVFINGLQIHEGLGADGTGEGWTSDGQIFVFNLPYQLEDDDHVVISGRLV